MTDVEVSAQWATPLDTAFAPAPASSAPASPSAASRLEDVAARAALAGIRRVQLLAWRDLDDPEAGGSELHAHRIASLWASVGLDVVLRTSAVSGLVPEVHRNGYKAVRRSGRYGVFPATAVHGVTAGRTRPDGVVEIWNGMPFFTPLWSRRPRVVFLHHVHAEMWRMVLSPALGRAGELMERRLAPPLYRRSRVVTLSASSRREIVAMLGLPAGRVSVVPPGVDPVFTPGGVRSPEPMVLSVGRLVPVKRFELLIDALVEVRRRFPSLRATIIGEGNARDVLEAKRRAVGGEGWIDLPGRVSDAELLAAYRRAWVLASASQREGWGMTITEAGACATPSVVTRIAGHADAVVHGESGLLVDDVSGLAEGLAGVLGNDVLRRRLGAGARAAAGRLTWEAAAAGTLEALVEEATPPTRRRRGATPPSR